jgi:hypothetical protein
MQVLGQRVVVPFALRKYISTSGPNLQASPDETWTWTPAAAKDDRLSEADGSALRATFTGGGDEIPKRFATYAGGGDAAPERRATYGGGGDSAP